MKAPRTWVLIANGANARIVENTGVGKGISPVRELSKNPRRRSDVMTDRPGRVHESQGTTRHAMEPTSDPVREDEKQFAQMLCDFLENAKATHKFDRLIVIAAPQTLGDLRSTMGSQLKTVVHAEIAKDLTHTPDQELPRHLAEVLAV